MDLSEKEQKMSSAILDYLKKNPGAGDTLEGITRWWLEFERMEASKDEVVSVLKILVHRGFLNVRQTNGPALYSLNKTRLS